MINKHKWRIPNNLEPESFCKKIIIRSQCRDGGLFIDGGIGVNFNAGTTAVLECFEEDSLKSIVFQE